MHTTQKTLYIEGAEDDYKVIIQINVQVTPPDFDCDSSDIDYLGCTELLDYWIYSVEKRIQNENFQSARSAKDWLTYNWVSTEINSLPKDDQDYVFKLVEKEVQENVNC